MSPGMVPPMTLDEEARAWVGSDPFQIHAYKVARRIEAQVAVANAEIELRREAAEQERQQKIEQKRAWREAQQPQTFSPPRSGSVSSVQWQEPPDVQTHRDALDASQEKIQQLSSQVDAAVDHIDAVHRRYVERRSARQVNSEPPEPMSTTPEPARSAHDMGWEPRSVAKSNAQPAPSPAPMTLEWGKPQPTTPAPQQESSKPKAQPKKRAPKKSKMSDKDRMYAALMRQHEASLEREREAGGHS